MTARAERIEMLRVVVKTILIGVLLGVIGGGSVAVARRLGVRVPMGLMIGAITGSAGVLGAYLAKFLRDRNKK
jgi:membrane associated rhomboid family serine protease